MKSISSELSLDVFTIASLAWSLGPRRVSILELFVMECPLMLRAVFELPLNDPFVRVIPAPGGPVERMKSAKSCIDSLGILASLA
jgi:hypothetical protein